MDHGEASAVKLAPNVGLEASEIPYGGLEGSSNGQVSNSRPWMGRKSLRLFFGSGKVYVLGLRKILEKSGGWDSSGPDSGGVLGLRPLIMVSVDGHKSGL